MVWGDLVGFIQCHQVSIYRTNKHKNQIGDYPKISILQANIQNKGKDLYETLYARHEILSLISLRPLKHEDVE